MKTRSKILSIALVAVMIAILMIPVMNVAAADPVDHPMIPDSVGQGLTDEANTDGSIVISAPNGISLADSTFSIYQIYRLESFDIDNNTYAYTINTPFEGFDAYVHSSANNFLVDSTSANITLQEYLESNTVDTSDGPVLAAAKAIELTQALMDYIKGTPAPTDLAKYTITATAPSTLATGDTLSITGIPLGYYMIMSDDYKTTDPNNDTPVPTVKSLCVLTTTNKEADITIKADAPTLDKQVWNDKKDGGADWDNHTDVNIGDTVNFQLVSHVPDMNGYDSYVFNVHDMMSPGLTYNDDIAVSITGATLVPADYKVEYSTNGNDYYTDTADTDLNYVVGQPLYIKVSFTHFIDYMDLKGHSVVVTYSATLNEEATINNQSNPNEAWLEYSNNPYTDDKGETPHSIVHVYTFDINVHKYTDNGAPNTPLANAKFELYRENDVTYNSVTDSYTYSNPVEFTTYQVSDPNVEPADGLTNIYKVAKTTDTNKITEFTSPLTGNIQLIGLEAGVYYLKETAAPQGYNALTAPIKVEITYTVNPDTGVMAANGYTVNVTDLNQPALLRTAVVVSVVKVQNNTGNELPHTGGIGRTIFYIGGTLLVVIAGFALIVRSKISKKGNKKTDDDSSIITD
ncbi:MAG: SpaH/EbpB family LPXTG-anchored major pilin [Oscillospiraceae bacterium]|nr:SpaH/EbpB family LPXTG-anchored major pilin [Oscillospiraceae bacterium]